MIILESQIADIQLDTVQISVSGPYLHQPFLVLETVDIVLSFPASPSQGLIQLGIVDITLSLPDIPASVPFGVALSPAVVILVPLNIGIVQFYGCETLNVLANIKAGGSARATPGRFVDCDVMDIVDAIRAGTTKPTIPYDDTDMLSSLLNALDLGNPVPFVVPEVGSWCDSPTYPPVLPVVDNAIIRIAGTTPFDVDISADKGITWADHPNPTINTSTPPSGSEYILVYCGEGVLLFTSWMDPGIINITQDYGLTWIRMDISAMTTKQIGMIYSYENLVFLADIYDGGNSGKLLRSAIRGASYTAYTLSDAWCVNSISAIDIDTLLMCKRLKTGYGGIAKSTDGGITWTDKYTSVLYYGAKIKYLDNGIAICAETGRYAYESQTMLRSTDYGETWTQISNNIAIGGYISYIEYLGSGIVLIVGIYGKVYRSIDYGLTWALVYNGGEEITNIMNLGNGEIIVTMYGYYDTIWIVRSTDYGATWVLGARIANGLYTYIDH